MGDTPNDDLSEFWSDPEKEEGWTNGATGHPFVWGDPDMGVLRLRRRPPPRLPIEVFGEDWGRWIIDAAKAAACPADYVAMALLSGASALIGNARWAQATPDWTEPPHLWTCVVGDSGDGKSPGLRSLYRKIIPELERRMVGDFPERRQEWRAAHEFDKAAEKQWQDQVRTAQKEGKIAPPPPRSIASPDEPQQPRLTQSDVTIEKVALILASAAPKGLVIVRDELAGWLDGMNAYNPAGRQFWIESYGGEHRRVERVKYEDRPIIIPHFAVAVSGGTQPDKLSQLMAKADDGLLSRIQWSWPDPLPFNLLTNIPNTAWAIEMLDKLRQYDLQPGAHPGAPPEPVLIPLTAQGLDLIREFGREMQILRGDTGGLLRSAYGKARGTALRVSLVLEQLWWCAKDGMALPPMTISEAAFTAAAAMVSEYFMPMAERVFGDAAATDAERMAATLARWIVKEQPAGVHVRQLQREIRLPGLRTAEQIKTAANVLVEADWLRPPPFVGKFGPRVPVIYQINPKLTGE